MAPSVVRRACWMLAAASVAAGAALWVLPAATRVAPAPAIAIDSAVSASPALVNSDVAEQIALGNVFAPSRTPPSTRYVPPEFAGESANGMMAEPGPEPVMAGPMDPVTEPRLLGTVVGPHGPQALLQLDPSSPASARMYAPGDGDAGYRVLSVTPRVVVLRGPRGRVTLRLDPQEDRP